MQSVHFTKDQQPSKMEKICNTLAGPLEDIM